MGKKIETEKAVRITADLPPQLWRAVKIHCLDNRKSVQSLVRELLADYLKKGRSR